MVPGTFHCSGVSGPTNLRQSGVQPLIVDAQHDATTALEAWVEHGQAPTSFIATKFANDTPAAEPLEPCRCARFWQKHIFAAAASMMHRLGRVAAIDTALLDVG